MTRAWPKIGALSGYAWSGSTWESGDETEKGRSTVYTQVATASWAK